MISRYLPGVCLGAGLLASGWAFSEESPRAWRLFDPEPTAAAVLTQPQDGETVQSTGKRSSLKQPAAIRYLVFNGVVSVSTAAGEQRDITDGLWINGYPLDNTSLPAGVRAVKWHPHNQTLEVILTTGQRNFLPPGERIQLGGRR